MAKHILYGASLAFLALLSPVKALDVSLRIIPLGDSITFGFYSSTGNGYRQDLLDLLSASSYTNVTYHGVLRSGSMVDNHHEGYPGARIGQIEQAGLKTLNSTAYPADDPNLVLIHAGTNDAYQNRTVSNMIEDLDHLINTIFTMKPSVSIVLSEIIMNKLSYVEETVKAYNLRMEDLVANRTAVGDHIVLVKQSDISLYTDDNPQHLDDPTHPGDIGFAKMARNFFYGITQIVNNGWI